MKVSVSSTVGIKFNDVWRDLIATVRDGFTGQLTLHCNGGKVMKVETREFEKVNDQ